MRAKRDDLSEVLQTADPRQVKEPIQSPPPANKKASASPSPANTDDMRMEINLIAERRRSHRRTREYLDRAFMAGLPRVRIIHGHGAGILRRAVREFLKSHPHVATQSEALRTKAPGRYAGRAETVVANSCD